MKRVDLLFLTLAAAELIVGVVMGMMMAGRQDFQLMPVHAHINLVGWASLALFGLTYRAYPELQAKKLASFHLVLSATAAVLFPIGVALAILKQQEMLVIAAATMWLAGAIIFLVQLLGLFVAANEVTVQPAE